MTKKKAVHYFLFLGKRTETVTPSPGNPGKWEVVTDGWACKRGELVRPRHAIRIDRAAERLSPTQTRVTPLDLVVVRKSMGSQERMYSVIRGKRPAIVPWLRLFDGDGAPIRSA